jgi:hypothetical protein
MWYAEHTRASCKIEDNSICGYSSRIDESSRDGTWKRVLQKPESFSYYNPLPLLIALSPTLTDCPSVTGTADYFMPIDIYKARVVENE